MSNGIIAVVFDFDDTLLPDSTSQFLRSRNIDVDQFWADAQNLVAGGYDETLSWLKLFLGEIGDGRALGPLTNADLSEFGAELDATFFPGIPGLFTDLRRIVASRASMDTSKPASCGRVKTGQLRLQDR